MMDEVKRDMGKVVAAMLIMTTMAALSFQHKNGMTGAATTTTYGDLYGAWAFLFLAAVSFLIMFTWAMRKKRIRWQ